MPWRDWQFWVVTAVAAAGLWALLRSFRRGRNRPARRVALTVQGRPAGETDKED